MLIFLKKKKQRRNEEEIKKEKMCVCIITPEISIKNAIGGFRSRSSRVFPLNVPNYTTTAYNVWENREYKIKIEEEKKQTNKQTKKKKKRKKERKKEETTKHTF